MKQDAKAIVAKYKAKYGEKSAYVGNVQHDLNVIPTGILALDYALGIGGWPRGHFVEVYGAPNIGKTSIIGYSALASAQRMGLQVGIINVEPRYDAKWVERNGVDIDNLVVMYPDTGEEAFEILRDWTSDPDAPFDYILFDSLGALVTEKDLQPEAKIQFGGQSKLITEGIKRSVMAAWKNNVGVMLINQQRDDVDSSISGLVDSPGGWAAKHAAMYRVHVRPGSNRYTAMIDGDKRLVGRELVANIKKSAAGDSLGAQPRFDWYFQDVEGMPFGLDVAQDVLATGLKTKVIEGSGWYKHPSFPGGKLQGKPAIQRFFQEHPEAIEPIRQDVLKVMARKVEERSTRQKLELVK
jgi:recombination protein RecA